MSLVRMRRGLMTNVAALSAAGGGGPTDFSNIRFDGTNTSNTGGYMSRSGTISSDSKQAIIGLRWGAYTAPASNQIILQAQSGHFLMDQLTSDLIRFQVQNSSGVTIVDLRFDLSGFADDGTLHKLLIGIDTALGSTNGLKVSLDGVGITPTVNTFTNDTMNLGRNTTWDYMIGSGNNGNFNVKSAYLYLESAAFLDMTNPTNIAKFDYATAGSNMSGVTGGQPDVAITGTAAEMGAGTGNKGNGGAWSLVGQCTNV